MAPDEAQVDDKLIKALARTRWWKRMLDDGRYASVIEMTAAEKLE